MGLQASCGFRSLTAEFPFGDETSLFRLNVNPATVYRLIYLGHLKVLRSFGRLRISRQQLERLLSQTEIYTPRRRRRK